MKDNRRDIIYRTLVLDSKQPTYWYAPWESPLMGETGSRFTLQGAKNSARSAGLKKDTYEIWKFHVGIPSPQSPYFPPERVL